MSAEHHYCPSHPNPLCPMKEKKGKCELCGFDHDKKSLSREDLRVRWEAAGTKGREALAEHVEEEKARKEMEVQAKAQREAEENARKEAEEKAEAEAERNAKAEADKRAKMEAEACRKAEREAAEVRARKEAEEKARKESEEKNRKEADNTSQEQVVIRTPLPQPISRQGASKANWLWIVACGMGLVLLIGIKVYFSFQGYQERESKRFLDLAIKQELRSLSEKSAGAPAQSEAYPALKVFRDCEEIWCPKMVVIPNGSFTMGSSEYDFATPLHSVNVDTFALGQTEVTQGQWKAVMGGNPSSFKDCGDDCPVENISWEDAKIFVQKLNDRMEKIGKGRSYRLPSESEWEYAARAGSQNKWTFGDDEGKLKEYGWYIDNSGVKTHPVGGKKANAFGLYDMHGNVGEWVEDCWNNNYSGAPVDGSAWKSSECGGRVLRGGSLSDAPKVLGSACRYVYFPDVQYHISGFRIARTLP